MGYAPLRKSAGTRPGAFSPVILYGRNGGLRALQVDYEKAIEHLEAAVEAMYNTITTVADVATDQSDRGLIAVLNEFAYRPLLAEFEKLEEAD